MGDLAKTVTTGDRVASLRSIRDHLAANLEVAAPQYVAALSKQLSDVMRELESLAPPKRESRLDELAAARAARRKATTAPKRASGGQQRRNRSRGTDGGGGSAT